MTQRVTKTVPEQLAPLNLNWDVFNVIVLFFASFALYARTAAPGVLDGDLGEFQTNVYNLGVSHTGYPLYFILAKLWTLVMPVGTIAYRANVFSGLFGALTLVLIYGMMRTLTERRVVALLTALLFGVSRVQWSQALIPDVYTLNSFFIVLVLWLAILRRVGRAPLWWVALAYGFSLTHHRTMIWLAPALGIFALLGAGRDLFRPRELLKNLAALLLPLLLYLYIPLRGASDVGVEYHPGNNINIFAMNALYDLRFGPPGFIWERITQVYLALLVEQFTIVAFTFGLFGIIALALQRAPRGFPKNLPPRQLLLLLGLAHLAETAFAIVFWVIDSEIFFIPSYLTFLFFVGIGLALALDWLATRLTLHCIQGRQHDPSLLSGQAVLRRAVIASVTFALIGVCAFLLWTNFPRNDQSNNDAADARWQEILAQPLEENIIIMGPWEDLTPFEYYQYVENARRDLKRDKIIIHQDQLAFAPQGDLAAQVRRDLQNGTSVYLTRHPDDTETLNDFTRFDLTPYASLWRVSSRTATRRADDTQKFGADDELQSLSTAARPRAGDLLPVVLNWSPDAPLEKTRLILRVRDARDRVWVERETLPFGGRASAPDGKSGRDLQGIFIPPDAPPGKYMLELAALERDSQYALPIVGESNTLARPLDVVASERAALAEVLHIPRPLKAEFTDAKFWGYGVNSVEPRGGDLVEFSSWWQGLARGDAQFEIKLRDANAVESVLYQGALLPGASGEFNPQQIIRARHNLTIPPTAALGYARIVLALNGQTLPEIRVALGASQRKFGAPIIPRPQLVIVGDTMQLLGYKLERTQFRAGETLPLTLFWNAHRTPDTSYKVFVHLLDANGALRAQQDSIPQRGALPTQRWFPGEYVTDEYALVLPNDLAPGAYRLAIGMYDETTGARVPLRDTFGAPLPDNRVLLGDVITIRE
ncbi:MAG: DUF2723 domain-containing protein [Chloroflexi bacterium]|nr:DUF2723 domain-containing protein [Chloroflexota bacterium]